MSLLTPGHISERTWPVTCHKTTKTGTRLLWFAIRIMGLDGCEIRHCPSNEFWTENSHFSNSASGITSLATGFYDIQEWQEATRKNRGRQIEMGYK